MLTFLSLLSWTSGLKMFTEDNWIPDTLAEALRERLREKSSASTSPYSTFQLTKSSNGVGYCAFDGKNLPSVNLPDYLRRIAQYSGYSFLFWRYFF